MAEIEGIVPGRFTINGQNLIDAATRIDESNKSIASCVRDVAEITDDLMNNWSGEAGDNYKIVEACFRDKLNDKISIMDSSAEQIPLFAESGVQINAYSLNAAMDFSFLK